MSTANYVDISRVVLYESLDGSTTVAEDTSGAKYIHQVNDDYMSLSTSGLNYLVTKNSILEFEFKANAGVFHGIGITGIAENNATNVLSKKYKLAGSSSVSSYISLSAVETLPDGYLRFQATIGASLSATQSSLLDQLFFYTKGSSATTSDLRNLKLFTDIGQDGEFFSTSISVPESSLSRIQLVYSKQDFVPETSDDDQFLAELKLDNVTIAEASGLQILQPGDKAKITLNHLAPEAFVKAPTDPDDDRVTIYDRTVGFTRTPGELVSIALDANQHSRQSLADLQELLLVDAGSLIEELKTNSDNESDRVTAISSLLAYAGSKYWFDYDQGNENVANLSDSIAIQQRVGSGVVVAKPQLLSDGASTFIEHLTYGFAPVDMGVDLPNGTGGFIERTNGTSDNDAFQLAIFNGSALEHNIVEEAINSESVSTIKGLLEAFQENVGLDADNQTITNDAVLVFERTTSGSILYRGEWKEGDSNPPVGTDEYTETEVKAALNNHANGTGGLNKTADTIWDILNATANNGIRILIPRGKSFVGDRANISNPNNWIGSVYVAETPGNLLFAIAKEGGTTTNGGFSGNNPSLINPSLPQGNFKFSPFAGDPVNTANGSMFRDDVDISFPNLGVPLSFARHYDSQNEDNIGFGVGWTHSFSDHLIVDPDDTNAMDLIWVTSNGQRHTFKHVSGDTFEVPAALHGTFDVDGPDYVYRDKSGMEYTFEPAETAGVEARLQQKVDLNGNGVSLTYASADKLDLVKDVHDPLRRLKFGYHSNGKIRDINKFVDGNPSKGTWAYGLDLDFRLTNVHYAYSTNDTLVLRYEYYSSGVNEGLMEKITELNDETSQANPNTHTYEYYPNGRVFRVTDSEGHSQTFNYNWTFAKR